MTEDKDPDIVGLILAACQAQGLDADAAHMIEMKICAEYGGRRVYIPKKKAQAEKKKKIFDAGLSDKPTAQIVREQGISRSTLYRLMKRG